MNRCEDLENRGVMTETGRRTFKNAFENKIIPPIAFQFIPIQTPDVQIVGLLEIHAPHLFVSD